jgi:hypothetical protein
VSTVETADTQKVPGPVNVCILQVGVQLIVPPVADINCTCPVSVSSAF